MSSWILGRPVELVMDRGTQDELDITEALVMTDRGFVSLDLTKVQAIINDDEMRHHRPKPPSRTLVFVEDIER